MEHLVSNNESKKAAKSNAPVFSPSIQKKLSVGASNDSYEAEADSVADKVVQMNETPQQNISHTGSLVQRKCSKCEDEEKKIQRKPISEDNSFSTVHEPVIQAKCAKCEEEEKLRKKGLTEDITPLIQRSSSENNGESHAPDHIEHQIQTTRGRGSLMDEETRGYMEERFGVDFTGIRIHTNNQAAQMSNDLNAKAFTVGNDVYFNSGQYNPSTGAGKHLLAHELTHTIQQGGSSVKRVQKKTMIQRGVLGRIGRGIASGAEFAWDHTGGAAIRLGGRVIEWVEDRAEDIINEIAPGLLDFLRSSIWETIKNKIASGIDALTGGLFTQLQEEGLHGVLSSFVDGILLSLQGAVADACSAFARLADRIFNFLQSISSSALARLRTTFNRVSGVLNSIWSNYGKPVLEAIKHYARAAWDWIEEKIKWLWDLIEPIRNAIARAWNWIKRVFNIAWEGVSSVWDWIEEKATRAWNWIKQAIEPIKVPLMIIGGIIIMLSPLGPFVLIGAAAYGIYAGIQWIRQNWNNEVFVRFRNTIRETVLVPLQNGLQLLQNFVNMATSWLSSMLQSLQATFMNLVNAVAQSTIFRVLAGIVRRISNAIQQAAATVASVCVSIATTVAEIAQTVWTYIRPFLEVAAKITFLALNPWLIPIVMGAWYWRALPDCFKPPIINFVLRVMIAVLGAMPNFAMFGETWVQVKTKIIQFLRQTLAKSDEEKVAVANRVARMVSEMDLSLLSNQIEAARGAPAEFEGQMEEELLGVNLTTPLPFERTDAADMTPPSLESQLMASGIHESLEQSDAALFSRSTYTEEDIAVDSVAEFSPSPELRHSIISRTRGNGTVDLGTSDDSSRTVHGILSEMIPAGVETEEGIEGGEPMTEGGGMEGTNGMEPTEPGMEPARPEGPMTHEEETEWRLQQMMAQSSAEMATQACNPPAEAAGGGSETAGAFPEESKFGPLTRNQRFRYTMNQMGSGIAHWWQCNRSWLIPAIIGVIVVIVLAEILSGGAVTAALPAIFSALVPIMIGVAAIRAAYYLGEYVYKSISGDIAAASRSLARAFAVAAIEAIFALLGSSAFWKSLKGAVSGAARGVGRGAAALGRGATRVLTATGRVGRGILRGATSAGRFVLRTSRAVVNRGRLIMQGVRGRIGQGIRTLEDLSERLFTRLRFRGFRLTFRGGWFRLEGYINPWVLLATGRIEHFTQDELRLIGGTMDDTVRLGDDVFIAGTRQRGVVVGVHSSPTAAASGIDDASEFVGDLSRMTTDAERRLVYTRMRRLSGSRDIVRDARIAIIRERESTALLRRGLPLQPPNFQAHHIIPRELRRAFDDFFRAIGFNIEDGVRNGIMVPPDAVLRNSTVGSNPTLMADFTNSAFHLGSHPNYTRHVRNQLLAIRARLDAGSITTAMASSMVDDIIRRARLAIRNGGNVAIDSLTSF